MSDYKSRLKDKKICIYRFVEGGQGDLGAEKEEYIKIHNGKLWAYYRQASAKEYYSRLKDDYEEDAIFILNWRNDINPLIDVILYSGSVYEINRVDDYEGYKQDIRVSTKRSQRKDLSLFPGIKIE